VKVPVKNQSRPGHFLTALQAPHANQYPSYAEVGDQAAFVSWLTEAGIRPEEVITDGSTLYPALIAEIWPPPINSACFMRPAMSPTRSPLR
jgi:hypothetical protein